MPSQKYLWQNFSQLCGNTICWFLEWGRITIIYVAHSIRSSFASAIPSLNQRCVHHSRAYIFSFSNISLWDRSFTFISNGMRKCHLSFTQHAQKRVHCLIVSKQSVLWCLENFSNWFWREYSASRQNISRNRSRWNVSGAHQPFFKHLWVCVCVLCSAKCHGRKQHPASAACIDNQHQHAPLTTHIIETKRSLVVLFVGGGLRVIRISSLPPARPESMLSININGNIKNTFRMVSNSPNNPQQGNNRTTHTKNVRDYLLDIDNCLDWRRVVVGMRFRGILQRNSEAEPEPERHARQAYSKQNNMLDADAEHEPWTYVHMDIFFMLLWNCSMLYLLTRHSWEYICVLFWSGLVWQNPAQHIVNRVRMNYFAISVRLAFELCSSRLRSGVLILIHAFFTGAHMQSPVWAKSLHRMRRE